MCNRFRLTLTLVVSLVAGLAAATESAAQTASAKGSATVSGVSCQGDIMMNPVCSAGGSGAKISFSFQGDVINPNAPSVAVTGSFTASYPDTGLKTEFVSGTAQIFPSQHILTFQGTCQTTNGQGVIIGFATGPCTGSAQDNTSNGVNDSIFFSVFTTSGFIGAFGSPSSGNMNIN